MSTRKGRLNIAPYLRAEYHIAVKAWEDRKAEARAHSQANLKQYRVAEIQNSENRNAKVNTTKELASALKISTDTASRIIQIHEKAPEPIKEKCRTGEISVL